MEPVSVAEVPQRHRRNGWACPWHPFQAIAWFFTAFFALSYYSFLVFYIPGLWRIAGYVVPGLVLLVHVVCTVVTTSLDPAEKSVREKGSREAFDRSVHKHVIENYYCNICRVNVSEGAKHCRLCNKCVSDFDHHCKWLNTCVGARNYRWFLATVISGLVLLVLLFLLNLSLFVLYFSNRALLGYGCHSPSDPSDCNSTLRVLGAAIPDPVFPTLNALLGALSVLAIMLLGHLVCFHLYLLCKGLSTYEYIIRERERRVSAPPSSRRRDCWPWKKVNRVTPSDGHSTASDNASIGSAGMDNFGRTPQSSVSGEGIEVVSSQQERLELVSLSNNPQAGGHTVLDMEPLLRDKAAVDSASPAPPTLQPPVGVAGDGGAAGTERPASPGPTHTGSCAADVEDPPSPPPGEGGEEGGRASPMVRNKVFLPPLGASRATVLPPIGGGEQQGTPHQEPETSAPVHRNFSLPPLPPPSPPPLQKTDSHVK